jgi:hypothetical protein
MIWMLIIASRPVQGRREQHMNEALRDELLALAAEEFGPGTVQLFWTPFTGTEVEPRVRDLPANPYRPGRLAGTPERQG